MNKALFLDKDGTLIENVPYNADPQKVRLLPYAAEALKRLNEQDYLLIMVSNQSGIAKGYFTEADLKRVEIYIGELLRRQQAPLHAFYYCPHNERSTSEENATRCICRKPQPGMLLQAARDHQIDLAQSWMIGDILDDVEAGSRAGCRTILIDNGNETEWKTGAARTPDFIAGNWLEAADIILTH